MSFVWNILYFCINVLCLCRNWYEKVTWWWLDFSPRWFQCSSKSTKPRYEPFFLFHYYRNLNYECFLSYHFEFYKIHFLPIKWYTNSFFVTMHSRKVVERNSTSLFKWMEIQLNVKNLNTSFIYFFSRPNIQKWHLNSF